MLHAPSRSRPQGRSAPAPGATALPPGATVLPFDYGASFALGGRPGNVLQDVVNISPDGIFVATAIGYGFAEERARPLRVRPASPEAFIQPGDVRLGDLPIDALLSGLRLNPALHALAFRGEGSPGAPFVPGRAGAFADQPVARALLEEADERRGLLQRLKSTEEISFLFSIVDTATGRELQDEPTHNLASLGASDGSRPFRQLATPLLFQPRSSVRLQVIERSDGIRGTLHLVLFGYKLVGVGACPEPILRRLVGPPATPLETIGLPDERVVPFDHVATLPLLGSPGLTHERELALSTEGGFVVTSLGYGLQVDTPRVRLDLEARPLAGALAETQPTDAVTDAEWIDLGSLPLRAIPPDAWIEGLRLRPEYLRFATGPDGRLNRFLPRALADEIFERLNRPADVSFRYELFDGGRGRELQNEPLHNIAGLGRADGQRPFKRLSRALVLPPRSTLRLVVREHFGRGTLYFVLQGYKLLGPAPAGRRTRGGAR
jgi:hypothetical protein